jgi:hypothetical protein
MSKPNIREVMRALRLVEREFAEHSTRLAQNPAFTSLAEGYDNAAHHCGILGRHLERRVAKYKAGIGAAGSLPFIDEEEA